MKSNTLPAGVTLAHLTEMSGGWFIGNFTPVAHRTPDVEVAVQHFPAGYHGIPHYHRVATETTLLLSGRAEMAGVLLTPGDILTLAPGTVSEFHALEDCITVVIKHPGALNDKFTHGDIIAC